MTLDKLRGDGYGRAGHDHHEEGYILYLYIYTVHTHTRTHTHGMYRKVRRN